MRGTLNSKKLFKKSFSEEIYKVKESQRQERELLKINPLKYNDKDNYSIGYDRDADGNCIRNKSASSNIDSRFYSRRKKSSISNRYKHSKSYEKIFLNNSNISSHLKIPNIDSKLNFILEKNNNSFNNHTDNATNNNIENKKRENMNKNKMKGTKMNEHNSLKNVAKTKIKENKKINHLLQFKVERHELKSSFEEDLEKMMQLRVSMDKNVENRFNSYISTFSTLRFIMNGSQC